MKKLFFLFNIVFCIINGHNSFEFVDNKIYGALNPHFIERLVNTFNVDVFFETGTYCGATTLNAIPYFKEVYTVELHGELFSAAASRLSGYKNVRCYHGRSPDIMKEVVPCIQGRILFWLDAHYSGEGTALSYENPESPEAITAIRGELKAIKEANISDCVVLIDDIRGFGTKINGQIFLGCWAYPTLQEVQLALLEINPNFELALLGDTLLAYDKNKSFPVFSETVKACTKTRLYDGSNLSDAELLKEEEKIKNAPQYEKNYIKRLYDIMTDYKDPMFWHDWWYGLISLNACNYIEAYDAFYKVAMRNQLGSCITSQLDRYFEECVIRMTQVQ